MADIKAEVKEVVTQLKEAGAGFAIQRVWFHRRHYVAVYSDWTDPTTWHHRPARMGVQPLQG